MASATYDVLGIGNAIVDILARTDDAFLTRQGMAKGSMSLIDEAPCRCDLQGDGAGGGNFRRLGGQYDRRCRRLRRARRVCRQGEERSARRRLQPRHPRGEGRLRNQVRHRRSGDGLQLHPGDAGWRAHHEHLSRRCAESSSRRHRCGADRRVVDHLSRRLSLGSEGCEGCVREGVVVRARRGPHASHSRCRMRSASAAIAANFST